MIFVEQILCCKFKILLFVLIKITSCKFKIFEMFSLLNSGV